MRLTSEQHLDDGVLDSLTPERFATVLRAKMGGALALHEWSLDRDLRVFLLFGSMSGAIGSPGQGNYAAASTGLDALARHHAEPVAAQPRGATRTPLHDRRPDVLAGLVRGL